MHRYKTEDFRMLERPLPGVFAALLDFESWNRWWPKEVRFRVVQLTRAGVGSKLEVKMEAGSFFAEVASVEHRKSIGWVYRSSLYRGAGIWSVEEVEDRVKVRYESELPVHPSLVAEHFLNAKDFATRHARTMAKVFDGLDRWVREKLESGAR